MIRLHKNGEFISRHEHDAEIDKLTKKYQCQVELDEKVEADLKQQVAAEQEKRKSLASTLSAKNSYAYFFFFLDYSLLEK